MQVINDRDYATQFFEFLNMSCASVFSRRNVIVRNGFIKFMKLRLPDHTVPNARQTDAGPRRPQLTNHSTVVCYFLTVALWQHIEGQPYEKKKYVRPVALLEQTLRCAVWCGRLCKTRCHFSVHI